MKKAKIGVIGAGWWATEFHIPNLKKREDVDTGRSMMNVLVRKGSHGEGVIELCSSRAAAAPAPRPAPRG